MSDEETDRWFERGCETFFPDAKSFCHHYIPNNALARWLYKKKVIK